MSAVPHRHGAPEVSDALARLGAFSDNAEANEACRDSLCGAAEASRECIEPFPGGPPDRERLVFVRTPRLPALWR